MSRPSLKAISLLFALTAAVGACSSTSKTSSATSPTSGASTTTAGAGAATAAVNGENANNHGTKDVSGGGKFDVEVDSFYFNPTLFTAKAGDKLTLTLSNDSKTLHNFSVKEQNIDMDIPVGGKITVTVTLPASGTQTFFCKFHRTSGMLGGLQVEQS